MKADLKDIKEAIDTKSYLNAQAEIGALITRGVKALERIAAALENNAPAEVERSVTSQDKTNPLHYFRDREELMEATRRFLNGWEITGEDKFTSFDLIRYLRRIKEIPETQIISLQNFYTIATCEALGIEKLPTGRTFMIKKEVA